MPLYFKYFFIYTYIKAVKCTWLHKLTSRYVLILTSYLTKIRQVHTGSLSLWVPTAVSFVPPCPQHLADLTNDAYCRILLPSAPQHTNTNSYGPAVCLRGRFGEVRSLAELIRAILEVAGTNWHFPWNELFTVTHILLG